MQLILREDVANLGRTGDLVTVKQGYGRNYLIPRGLAVLADKRSVRRLEHEKRVIAQSEQKLLKTAQALKDKLSSVSISLSKQAGDEGKIFGSVTTREIAESLTAQGIEIDRRKIELSEPIKSLGVHEVKVQLARDVDAVLKVWVVAVE